ncbi:MAG: cytochrome c-type biogenesis protein [Actinomycetota bacterium]
MRSRRGALAATALAAALVAAGGALAVTAARGPEPPVTVEERAQAVAEGLRCPVCQNLSVADSPSALAAEMRRTIADRLRAGQSPEEIRGGFVAAYGEWILQEPPKRGINLVAWLAPGILFLAGAAAGVLAIRRWTAGGRPAGPPGGDGTGPPALPAADRRLLDRALASLPEEPE